MPGDDAMTFDTLDVLLRSGDARTTFLASVGAAGEGADVDPRLVSDVLRVTGRVGATVRTRGALVGLCAILRALDAALDGRIDVRELRDGMALHSARTDDFAAFEAARVLLRTISEVLRDEGRVATSPRAVRAQLALLDADLRSWMVAELLGTEPHERADVGGIRAAPRWQVEDREARAANDAIVEELFHGSSYGPVSGLLGAAWVRDWRAVPLVGERLDEVPGAAGRILAAASSLEGACDALLRIDRSRSPRWFVEGTTIRTGDGLRPSWAFPASPEAFEAVLGGDRRGWSVLTTRDLHFAIVEAAGHHAVLGPAAFVEVACGAPPLECIARFREHVEALAVEDEPPPDLLDVATSFGRFRRRSR